MRFTELRAWQECRKLAVDVYRATDGFPVSERYSLSSQMRRAVVSAAANIAEGNSRRGSREFARFLDIATASLSELECLAIIASDLDCSTTQRHGV